MPNPSEEVRKQEEEVEDKTLQGALNAMHPSLRAMVQGIAEPAEGYGEKEEQPPTLREKVEEVEKKPVYARPPEGPLYSRPSIGPEGVNLGGTPIDSYEEIVNSPVRDDELKSQIQQGAMRGTPHGLYFWKEGEWKKVADAQDIKITTDVPEGSYVPLDLDEDPRTTRRREFLKEVESCVCNDRQNSYGHAEDNFQNIADLVNIVLSNLGASKVTRQDVGIIMLCVKMARIRTSPNKRDNYVDLAGYAACTAGIVEEQQGGKDY